MKDLCNIDRNNGYKIVWLLNQLATRIVAQAGRHDMVRSKGMLIKGKDQNFLWVEVVW